MQSQKDQSHALRLLPGQDLRAGIQNYVNEHKIKAGWIITCAGSLTDYNIRFANASEGRREAATLKLLAFPARCRKMDLTFISA
ncbi:MAG TPA: PPC domain-containing DNA-binding protein [Segetibacter sp.]